MKKQPITTSAERKLKFAEAGILFVLVLAITVFVGVRMADEGDIEVAAESPTPAVVAEAAAPVAAEAAESSPRPDEVFVTEDEAASGPESATESSPRSVTYADAEQAYFAGDYADAAEQFEIYVTEHPKNAWGHYMLGLSAWKAGDAATADAAFTTALALKPDHVKSLVNSARVLITLERVDEARDRIDAALRVAPENVDALRVSARIAHNEGRLSDAADGYLGVLRTNGNDAWSLNNLGLIRIEQERFADALAPLAKAALLRPDMACVQNNLGIVLERSGHYEDAAEAYAAALVADPGYAKAELSLDRVGGLTQSDDLAAIDLAALANGFAVGPAADVVAAEADTVRVEDAFDAMAVVTNVGAEDGDGGPQNDGPQDR